MTSFDERWIEPAKRIVFSVSEIMPIMKALQLPRKVRDLFLQNEVENPRLQYDLSMLDFTDQHEAIDILKTAIASSDTQAMVAELYYEKLDRQLDRQALLTAVKAQDDQQFHEASVALYGLPKKKYFAYIAKRTCELCEQAQFDYPTEAKRLQKVVSKIDTSKTTITADVLPEPIADCRIITTRQQVVDIFDTLRQQLDLHDWKLTERSDTQGHFVVHPESQEILIPQEEPLLARHGLTETKVRAIAEHEIGVHAQRSARGYQSSLKLLGLGLDNYLGGEEGVASYVQQQAEGSREFYGFDRYLAASLAVGLDGTPRDFRAVFSLMTDYYTVLQVVTGEKVVPFKPAWDVCVRIFRGTSGTTPGHIYTKDIVYMEGNIKMWELLTEKPHVFDQLFIGKYNPLLPAHVEALTALDIITDW